MPPILWDTHAHLDGSAFAEDRDEVVRRAIASGVEGIVAVGITAKSSSLVLDLAGIYPGVYPAVGIHPNEIQKAGPGDWERIVELSGKQEVVAIGETGLDRYWDDTPFPIQEEWFARHLELARRRNLPIIIHCREAEEDALRMLRDAHNQHGPVKGIMHSFSGSEQTATGCLEMGLHLSFAGMITYKNAAALREVARQVPRERLLVETDCPYLTPVPFRGKRNEPAHVIHTARCLAELHGVSLEEMAAITSHNARNLFSRSRGKSRAAGNE